MVRAFIPRVSSRPFGMSLPTTSLVRLNRLRTGAGRFHSSIYKWGLAPSPNCEYGATEENQITTYLHISYIMYQEKH